MSPLMGRVFLARVADRQSKTPCGRRCLIDAIRPTFHIGLTILTTAFGGVLFEPLNGASLFSTVVKPRANLDTPSAHFRPTFHIGLTIPTTAIRRGSITACHGATLHVLMCFAPSSVFFALMKRGDWTPIIFITTSDSTNLFLHFIRKRGHSTKTLRYY